MGGSGHLVGEARVTGCIQLNKEDLPNHKDKHCIEDASIVKYRKIFAWVLEDARRYSTPRPYHHPMGAITWVRLPVDAPSLVAGRDAGRVDEACAPLQCL